MVQIHTLCMCLHRATRVREPNDPISCPINNFQLEQVIADANVLASSPTSDATYIVYIGEQSHITFVGAVHGVQSTMPHR